MHSVVDSIAFDLVVIGVDGFADLILYIVSYFVVSWVRKVYFYHAVKGVHHIRPNREIRNSARCLISSVLLTMPNISHS